MFGTIPIQAISYLKNLSGWRKYSSDDDPRDDGDALENKNRKSALTLHLQQ